MKRRQPAPRSSRQGRGGLLFPGCCALGLGFALVSLHLIGPPPAVRTDAIWVHGHRGLVQMALLGLAVAALATVPPILARRQRLLVALLWAAAAAVIVLHSADTVAIIGRVLWERVLK